MESIKLKQELDELVIKHLGIPRDLVCANGSIKEYNRLMSKKTALEFKNEYLNNPNIKFMKNQIEKPESIKVKRFTVKVDKIEVLNTSKKEEADAKISQLQTELRPLIILIDNQENKSLRYSKNIHQKNYRIEAGKFEKDSETKTVTVVTETQE